MFYKYCDFFVQIEKVFNKLGLTIKKNGITVGVREFDTIDEAIVGLHQLKTYIKSDDVTPTVEEKETIN